ncbi:MAG TPA: hypothetical protein VMI94_14920 [Bryobacteraceae bacterium]|nr:hypothetical protein [Bryobacteraceae bacterium]
MSDDVFRWVVTIGVLLACAGCIWQAVVLSALFRAGKKAGESAKEAEGRINPILTHLESALSNLDQILDENRTKVAGITAEALLVVKAAREHTERIGELIDDANARAKVRIAQIDETVGHTVDQVEHATDAVKGAVMKPVKEVGGLVAGVKAAFSTYAQGGRHNSPDHVTQDEEMFI